MSDSGDSEFEEVVKACNWCNLYSKLAPGKKYCVKCSSKCYRECKRCHRPFDDPKFFQKDQNRCNSCQTLYLKEREKRLKRKKQTTDMDEPAPKQSKSDEEKQEKPFQLPFNMSEGKIGFIPVFFQ